MLQNINQMIMNNRERILQNGPQRLMHENQRLKEETDQLDDTIEESNYYTDSNNELRQMILKVNSESDDVLTNAKKAVENVQASIQ